MSPEEHSPSEHEPTANPLAPLLEVEPEAAAIERAVRRAMQALEAAPAPVVSVRAASSESIFDVLRRRRQRALLAAGLAASIAVVALWIVWPRASVAHELAAMQERVAQTRTVEFDLVYPGGEESKSRIRILESGFLREDLADGSYIVSDLRHGRQLVVFPDSRTAILAQGLAPRHENFYEQIRRIPGETAEQLPDIQINGRQALGFRVVRPKVRRAEEFPWTTGTLVVWVDRETRLPLKIECHPLEEEFDEMADAEDDGDDETEEDSSAVDEALPDELRAEPAYTVLENIRFNASFDKSLFAFRAPAGHTLTVTGADRLPPLPANPAQATPELQPKVGLGPVRFGMSVAQVEALLGSPDQADEMTHEYFSRGYSLDFEEKKLSGIRCYGQPVSEWVVRDFAGRTTEGARLGNLQEEIERIYGPPDSVDVFDGETMMFYDERGLEFTLIQGKVVEILSTTSAGEE
jgi:hypothetical protein